MSNAMLISLLAILFWFEKQIQVDWFFSLYLDKHMYGVWSTLLH